MLARGVRRVKTAGGTHNAPHLSLAQSAPDRAVVGDLARCALASGEPEWVLGPRPYEQVPCSEAHHPLRRLAREQSVADASRIPPSFVPTAHFYPPLVTENQVRIHGRTLLQVVADDGIYIS